LKFFLFFTFRLIKFNLVCDRSYLKSVLLSLGPSGTVIATPFISSLSDWYSSDHSLHIIIYTLFLLKHKELAEDCHFSWLFALSPSPHFLQLYFETTSHLGLQHLFLVDCKLFISNFHLLWVCLCLKTAAHFNCCYLSKN